MYYSRDAENDNQQYELSAAAWSGIMCQDMTSRSEITPECSELR